MAGFAQQPYAVMISFRFSESLNEANALQDALQARGHRTFVSNEAPGADLQEAIATAMQQSQIQVLLATRTYGKKTNEQYSTYQEMNYALNHNSSFLVKMTDHPDSVWEEASTEMALTGRMYSYWAPSTPMPEDLVDKIVAKLNAIRAAKPVAAAVAAPAPAVASPDGSHDPIDQVADRARGCHAASV